MDDVCNKTIGDSDDDFLERFTTNLSKFLGKNCEIVLHDFSHGFDNTIKIIYNGHVTNRRIGSPATNIAYEDYTKNDSSDTAVYFNTLENGRILKSSTTLIRDEDNKPIGAICINMDITDLMLAQNAIYKHTMKNSMNIQKKEVFVKDVQDLMDYYLTECQLKIGKAGNQMTKDEKVSALSFLDSKGFFMFSKAGVKLCSFFDISKYTLYSYLEEARKTSNT